MVEKWVRIVANGTAATNSNDTTETEIGSGVTVPPWAKSVLQGRFTLGTITMTTQEDLAGYVRIYNANNDIEPLYFPMPVVPANLAGAAAGQMHSPVWFPVMQNVTAGDTLEMAAAFDAATTGVHVFDGYFLFSSQPVGLRIHSQKMAITAIGDALAESAEVTIKTIANKSSKLLGILGYANIGGTVVAAEGIEPYLRVKSDLEGWQEQQLPLNVLPASLGADSYIQTKPVAYLYRDAAALRDWFDGFHRPWLGVSGPALPSSPTTFTMSAQHIRDPDNNVDANFRAFVLWQE